MQKINKVFSKSATSFTNHDLKLDELQEKLDQLNGSSPISRFQIELFPLNHLPPETND